MTCSVEGCDKKSRSTLTLLCDMHYQRKRINGDVNTVRKTGSKAGVSKPQTWLSNPSYNTIHARVASVRGKASTHMCIDCGESAREWSCKKTADLSVGIAKWGNKTIEVSYSQDIYDYDPRCKSCHKKYDYTGNQYEVVA